jgi:hypothetical protein
VPLTFDSTLKDLARNCPADFLSVVDPTASGPVTMLNVDLSVVTTATDLVFGLGDPLKEILHVDCQASASATKHLDVMVYHALLHRQYQVPVHSVYLLLRPQAAHSNQDGTVAYAPRAGRGRMDFGYEIIRLWKRSAEDLLTGPPGAVPLAVLGHLPQGVELEDGLASVVQRLVQRLWEQTPHDQAKRLITSAYLLAGLRVQRQKARQLFRGVTVMSDSDTYLAILDEGALREARDGLLRQGHIRFGPPDDATRALLDAMTEADLPRLHVMQERLLRVNSWQELFPPD